MTGLLQPQWETFPHDADIGVRGYGATAAEAFVNAALAMMSVITDPCAVRGIVRVPIACIAPDSETLLVDWLNAIVLEMATQNLLFSRFAATIQDDRLEGAAWGEPLDMGRHRPAVEIKGATYTALDVAQDKDGRWRAQCVVDV
jgi:SHS2 domain-containing protein